MIVMIVWITIMAVILGNVHGDNDNNMGSCL